MNERGRSLMVLTANTVAFGVCFAVWVMYGVLVTFLVDNKVFAFDKGQIGLLIGIPILTGSVLRLPAGLLTDKLGGRPVFTGMILISAVFTYLTSLADSFLSLLLCGLGFGLTGATFAAGVAYTSLWFQPASRGTALGIFGVGNMGAGLASLFAPQLLDVLTAGGKNLDGWRQMPRIYAAALAVLAVLYWFSTFSKRPEGESLPLSARLQPLRVPRVWRFGLYYFLVFGGFVALSSWLIAYYVNVYGASVARAGAMAALFSLPAGLVRVLGGWLADRYGPRPVMYGVLAGCSVSFLLLSVPRMDIYAPGEGLMAPEAGTVGEVRPESIVLNSKSLQLSPKPDGQEQDAKGVLVWPRGRSWQEPAVVPGTHVARKQLLARGVTHIYFQANMTIFAGLSILAALFMGVGAGAVFKYVADYFPTSVGTVGGLVGVIGGLGGFFGPVLFGYLLKWTGIWTTCWLFFFGLSLVCLAWMYITVQRLQAAAAPHVRSDIEIRPAREEIERVASEIEELAKRLRHRKAREAK
ncbi:MAG: hypothetical protein DIJKHBIC_03804 [Thermoanaerobaculia bacterium]|nr:hypothetical protein [Thermoanaerobaculia bacterium]